MRKDRLVLAVCTICALVIPWASASALSLPGIEPPGLYAEVASGTLDLIELSIDNADDNTPVAFAQTFTVYAGIDAVVLTQEKVTAPADRTNLLYTQPGTRGGKAIGRPIEPG